MKLKAVIFLLFTSGLMACSPRQEPIVSWYHWSHCLYQNELRSFQKVHDAPKLYVRLFDIKWHSVYGAYPEAIYNCVSLPDSLIQEIVPVIYITNESIILTPEDSIPILQKKIQQELEISLHDHFDKLPIKELQIDCDWTEKSKTKYFQLLRLFKENMPVQISATVKLYQYAYRDKAGVPPVDRAVLMCYNIHNPTDYEVKNAIFDGEEMVKYLNKADYPIPLDIALPTYTWTVWYRDGRFQGLINAMDAEDLSFWPLVKTDSNEYRFTKEVDNYSHYYQVGDVLRIQSGGPEDFLPYSTILSKHLNDPTSSIILFDFDQFNSSIYAHDSLFSSRISRAFRH